MIALNVTECQTTLSGLFPGPRPPSGKLRVRDVTHSTLWLDWDAAPGPVIKYLVTYQPDNGEAKEVSFGSHAQKPCNRVSLARLLKLHTSTSDLSRDL